MDVAIVGDGQLAGGVAAALASRSDVRVLGPTTRAEQSGALSSEADVVIVATTTRLADVLASIETAIVAGSNVIVSAEESAYPWAVDDAAARRLDALAQRHGVTVLGCGLNPGFVFDALVLTLLGVCVSAATIAVRRTVDLSGFGPAVRARLGLGVDQASFQAGIASDEILGHAGFPQSMAIVARAIGAQIERIETRIEAVMADGISVGVRQHYTATVAGLPWYQATFDGHLDPASVGLIVRDEVHVTPQAGAALTCVIEPGIGSQAGSQAIIANSIDRVIEARAGWLTVADLPPAHPFSPLRPFTTS